MAEQHTYRPDVYGLVEGPPDAPPEVVQMALDYECPDCRVNVFIQRAVDDANVWSLAVAHDDTCPWLKALG